jgi:hypothetical protein
MHWVGPSSCSTEQVQNWYFRRLLVDAWLLGMARMPVHIASLAGILADEPSDEPLELILVRLRTVPRPPPNTDKYSHEYCIIEIQWGVPLCQRWHSGTRCTPHWITICIGILTNNRVFYTVRRQRRHPQTSQAGSR